MGWLLALVGLVAGFFTVYHSGFQIPIGDAQYISLAALAGLDSLIGGLRSAQEGKYQNVVFVSGFITNTLLAALLAYVGDRLGQPLSLAAVVTLGQRIFVNMSILRRTWLERNIPGEAAATPAPAE